MIQANDFKSQWLETREETLAAVDAVGSSGWYILGTEVASFETALALEWPSKHAVGVASGLDALEISLRVLGCKPGDYVLTTPVSAFATTLAIHRIGAIAVFVDCDPDGLIDLDRCEAALRSRPEIRFLMPVHLYGHSLDLERLRSLQKSYGISIVEDCAQSILASSCDGAMTGTAGDIAATSFYPTKNLGAIGDGGAILTSNDELAQQARVLRDYGQASKYRHTVPGQNSRLDELQAAILRRVHLPRLRRWTDRRRQIAQVYIDGIENPRIRVSRQPSHSHSCWHLFPVFVEPAEKTNFISWMRQHEVMVAEHYPVAIPDQPAMAGIRHEMLDGCQRARQCCESEVSLPIHAYLSAAQMRTVINVCNEWNR